MPRSGSGNKWVQSEEFKARKKQVADEIGPRLRQARTAASLSTGEVGEMVERSSATVRNWETTGGGDGKLPSITQLTIMAELYGVSVGWLAAGERCVPNDPVADTGDGPIAERLARAYQAGYEAAEADGTEVALIEQRNAVLAALGLEPPA